MVLALFGAFQAGELLGRAFIVSLCSEEDTSCSIQLLLFRDHSFFMGRGEGVVFWGGPPEKNRTIKGGHPKNERSREGGPSKNQKKGGEFFYTI